MVGKPHHSNLPLHKAFIRYTIMQTVPIKVAFQKKKPKNNSKIKSSGSKIVNEVV
jgi:hypothetical protein